jgi:hypothetical protein
MMIKGDFNTSLQDSSQTALVCDMIALNAE